MMKVVATVRFHIFPLKRVNRVAFVLGGTTLHTVVVLKLTDFSCLDASDEEIKLQKEKGLWRADYKVTRQFLFAWKNNTVNKVILKRSFQCLARQLLWRCVYQPN